MDARVLLVLPTLDEEEALVKLAPEIPGDFDVLVVDSYSTDRTVEVAREAGYACIRARYGRGQGSGIRTGFEYFLENGYSHLLLMDADYTDDPRDLPKVLSKLKAGGFDVVVGVRDFDRQREYLGSTTLFIKKLVSYLILKLTGLRVRDMLTGVWAFRRESIEVLSPRLGETGFEYGFEIIYNAWITGLTVGEEDVGFRRRLGETKLTFTQRMIQVCYGIKYALKVIAHRLSAPTRSS
jgi:dolichol-phosphate mannosyltransferase